MARASVRFSSGRACKMTDYFPGVILVLLAVFFQSVEPCLPPSIQASVPWDVMAGHVISRVNLARCDVTRLALTSDDPRFSIQRDGTVVAQKLIRVPPQGSMFSIWFQDQNGHRQKMDIGLSRRAREEPSSGLHRRYKRRWSPLPFLIPENDIPPFPKSIDEIGSDTSQNYSLYYTISGPGVTEDPVGVFSVDRFTGMLKVHKSVDREAYPVIKFTARAINQQTQQETDKPLIVTVNVLDRNDNAPQFAAPPVFSVAENSRSGGEVGTIIATDADQLDTPHTKISYKLLSGIDLFTINPASGLITTKTATMDREVQDTYLVTVEIRDMNGARDGLASTGTATISLSDVNDNAPTFRKAAYDVKVVENENSGLILRIPVDDKDLQKTPNWKAVFKIIKGNENGNFRIETDPVTNEGLLYVAKPLDYEKNKNLQLKVVAENEAPLVTSETWASALVDVTVEDVDEGPEFVPLVQTLWVKENTPNGTVIDTYTAIDPETKNSAGIRYYEVSDPASWIKVDEKTGDLKITNTVDRESPFVQNGVYNITVKAVDASSKSSTGTVVINVIDDNDNMPKPLGTDLVICEKKGELGSVLVVAEDKDEKPFSDPFIFHLANGHDGKWKLNEENGTAAWLTQAEELHTGSYQVLLEIKDQQGAGKLQTVTVRICQCVNGKCPPTVKSSALGVWGVLALLLGLALLLLLAVCCAMKCAHSEEKFHILDGTDGGGMLLKSNTEAPGDAVTSDIMVMPSSAIDQSVKGSYMDGSHVGIGNANAVGMGNANAVGMGNANAFGSGVPFQTQQSIYRQSGEVMMAENQEAFSQGMYAAGGSSSHLVDGQVLNYMDPASLLTWNTNAMFIDQKLEYLRTQEDWRYADDLLHSYGFEGKGTPAGSVGCCSEQGEEDGLEFLNTLGSKFKDLAEVCHKK